MLLAATGDSPAEVIAWAQATLNAVAYDDDFGLTRDAATAKEIAANAWDQWVNAELDKWAAANPGLEDRASKGAVADAAAFTDIVNELIAAAVAADQAQELLGDPNAATQSRVRAAFELDKTFLTKLADNLQSDRAFQKQLDGGLASDFDSVSEFVTLLTGAARRFLLVGDEALWTTFVPIVGESDSSLRHDAGSELSDRANPTRHGDRPGPRRPALRRRDWRPRWRNASMPTTPRTGALGRCHLRADRSPATCDLRDRRPRRRGGGLCARDARAEQRLARDDVGDPDLDDAGRIRRHRDLDVRRGVDARPERPAATARRPA